MRGRRAMVLWHYHLARLEPSVYCAFTRLLRRVQGVKRDRVTFAPTPFTFLHFLLYDDRGSLRFFTGDWGAEVLGGPEHQTYLPWKHIFRAGCPPKMDGNLTYLYETSSKLRMLGRWRLPLKQSETIATENNVGSHSPLPEGQMWRLPVEEATAFQIFSKYNWDMHCKRARTWTCTINIC